MKIVNIYSVIFISISLACLLGLTEAKKLSAGKRSSHRQSLDRRRADTDTDSGPFEDLVKFLLRSSKTISKVKNSRQVSKADDDEDDDDDDSDIDEDNNVEDVDMPSSWLPYEERHYRRALEKLSVGQAALKTMDGATHTLRNTFSSGAASLEARYDTFLDVNKRKGGMKSKNNRKEAAKLYEYVETVERCFQACEILQACSSKDDKRVKSLHDAGLEEMRSVPLEHNKIRITMSVCRATAENSNTLNATRKDMTRPTRFSPTKTMNKTEIVLIFYETDSNSFPNKITNLLDVMSERSKSYDLASVGFVDEEVSVQPTMFEIAGKALQDLSKDSNIGQFIQKSAMKDIAKDDNNSVVDSTEFDANSDNEGNVHARHAEDAYEAIPGQRIRIYGYSAGGAVGAYVGMVLEGSMNISSSSNTHTETIDNFKKYAIPFIGTYKDAPSTRADDCPNSMMGFLIAPPPCVSRSIVSKGLTSLICGDDIVPRASPESLRNFRKRVLKALSQGAGKGGFSGLGYTVTGAAGIRDLTSQNIDNLGRYTGNVHDLESMKVPGRVFYLKSRAHKDGATLQRVLRGNWREDMLWQLNDIMLSEKMMNHHSIDYHIQALDRL